MAFGKSYNKGQDGGISMFHKFIKVSLLPVVATLTIGSFLTNLSSNTYNVSSKQIREKAEKTQFEQPTENYDINVIDSEKSFDATTESFLFSSPVPIDYVSKEGDVNLVNFKYNEGEVSCVLTNFIDNSNVILNFYLDSELIDRCTLYFAESSAGIIYSSAISLDTACRNAGQELNYELADENEEDSTTSVNRANITPCDIGASGTIYGTLRWTDEQGNTHPLIGAKVKATMSMSWWNAETYTNSSGYYVIDYTDIWHLFGGIPMIHIYTESDNVKVHNGGTYEKTYEFSSGSGGEFSYTFSPTKDGDMGKAMMLFQGLKNFSDYAEELNGGVSIEYCNLKYPDGTDGAYYDGNGTIHISAETPKHSFSPESYASWDVLGHEYGHHVQKVFGISANPGGTHYIPGNNIDDQYKSGYSLAVAKDRGQKLSWGEGWPTYWSTVVQSHFTDDLKSIYTVGDTKYTSTNGFDYELDSYGTGRGDADEQAIQRFLFKLCDSKTDANDKFALGEMTLWNSVITNRPVTFSEFIQDLYDDGYNKHNLGILLEQYNVINGIISVTNNQYFDKLPTFSWSTDSGSDNLKFNQFDLYFETPSGYLIEKVSNISASGDSVTYKPTSAIWNKIYNAYGSTFSVYFAARQTYSYTSGNYYSEINTFSKPSSFSSGKAQVKPNEWGFEGRYYFSNEIYDIDSLEEDTNHIRFSTFTRDGLTITTERLRCGYIENSYVNLSPRRKNAGHAYLEMNFNRPVYSILYSVGLWSSSENLDGTATLFIKDAGGNWSKLQDLLSLELKTKEQGHNRYSHYFTNGIYGLRFECTSTATGSRNKGRLSIDDIVFGTKTGTSENEFYITNYGKTSA